MRPTHVPALAAVAAAAALAVTGCSSPTRTASPPAATTAPASSSPVAGPQAPPSAGTWGAPADASAAVKAAGLPMLGEEKLAVHYHAHVDVIVNGQHIPVPADLGVDEARHLISPLHTHDGTGVVHIESATDVPFTLGQLFMEWGQPLQAERVGPVSIGAGQALRVYRNGQPVTSDPGALRLGAHDEIVVWVGPADQQPQVPSSYAFPPGE
jgi:hypothetical protein